ncbi:MAG: hypothetical protein OXI88_14575 [Gammaproteobacteria bacterium]|nr:hypothetical protein [Gammaproteobacteria bacterium]
MHLHIRVEGTAAEISDVLRALPGAATVHTAAVELTDAGVQATTSSETPEPESRFVTTRFARRVLNRLPISKPMKNVLSALCKAHPEWLSRATLRDAAGYGSSEYAGMMGAFGRRIANTEGYDSETDFFEGKWDDDERTWYCRLPDTVREALTLEELI